ncbi:hypothetical protein BGLA2_1670042 [Burkholderia gladioli]|nr:hypothetical protein BGLA2_1670042 [Burkholderia gladioli]
MRARILPPSTHFSVRLVTDRPSRARLNETLTSRRLHCADGKTNHFHLTTRHDTSRASGRSPRSPAAALPMEQPGP